MTIICRYDLSASAETAGALRTALKVLAQKVEACAGCDRVEVFVDQGDPLAFTMVEHWRSQADRDAAGAALGRAAFAEVMGALSQKPVMRLFNSF